MKVTFFTILLDGMPFLPYLADLLLPVAHEWFFVEGATRPVKCTRHCALPPAWSYDPATGLSTDGTKEYLDQLAARDPRVKVIRPAAGIWNGKVEMVNSFLPAVTGDYLWELDVDEFFTPEAVRKTIALMDADPAKTCARFYCYYFFGDTNTVTERSGLGNEYFSWYRCWRYRPDAFFRRHEPPEYVVKARRFGMPYLRNLSKYNVLERDVTEAAGILMYHYAYVAEQQIRFKEEFYKWHGLSAAMQALRRKLTAGQYPRIEDDFPMLDTRLYQGQLIPFDQPHPLKGVAIR
jgi:glycosyltransferase involved in cell wall biosynthesis